LKCRRIAAISSTPTDGETNDYLTFSHPVGSEPTTVTFLNIPPTTAPKMTEFTHLGANRVDAVITRVMSPFTTVVTRPSFRIVKSATASARMGRIGSHRPARCPCGSAPGRGRGRRSRRRQLPAQTPRQDPIYDGTDGPGIDEIRDLANRDELCECTDTILVRPRIDLVAWLKSPHLRADSDDDSGQIIAQDQR
jgi:hypothetical protein